MLDHLVNCDSGGGLDDIVGCERNVITEYCESNPNTVVIGALSGELRLDINHESDTSYCPSREVVDGTRIESAHITRTKPVQPSEDCSPEAIYHAVITGFEVNEISEEPLHQTETFHHPMPALAWIESNVPDFDLLPTVLFEGDDQYDTRPGALESF